MLRRGLNDLVDCSRDRVVTRMQLWILRCTEYAVFLLNRSYLVALPSPTHSRGLKLLPLFAIVDYILIIAFIAIVFLFFFGHLSGIPEILVLLGFSQMLG